MIFFAICGLLVTVIMTNMFIFMLNKVFHKYNYKSTPLFYYLLSFIVILSLGSLIGLYTVRSVL